MKSPERHRLDPVPSQWLLKLKYGRPKKFNTRSRKAPYVVQWRDESLCLTTSTGVPHVIPHTDFADSWGLRSANPRIRGSRAGRYGTYVLPIYVDLHQRVAFETPPRDTWRVYAIELAEDAWAADRELQADHPRRDFSKPCLYVGSTKKSVWRRYLEHRGGGRNASDLPHRFGLRPLPELCEQLGTLFSENDAVRLEQQFANELRGQGFAVDSGGPGMISDALSKYPRKARRRAPGKSPLGS